MMKTITRELLFAASLLMGGTLLTACSGDDITTETPVVEEPVETVQGVPFTATLDAKDDATRSITLGTDGDGKETLNVRWQVGEWIAVYYLKSDGTTHATARAVVTAVDETTGRATITTHSTTPLVDPMDGSEVKFVYPYTLAMDGEIKVSRLLQQQDGTIDGISTNFDAATGTGTLSVSAGTAVTTAPIALTNQCCICKFRFTLQDESATATHYDVSIKFKDGYTYTLSMVPKWRMSDLYVAMLPVDPAARATITATGYHSPDGQSGTEVSFHGTVINSVLLEARKFYRNVPVTLDRGDPVDYSQYNIYLSNSIGWDVAVPHGQVVLLDGATITGCIYCLGDATIILRGTNSVSKGIWAGPIGTTLTIKGSGSLTATGDGSAGIGSGPSGTEFASCGNILIKGGNITATGGNGSAGIGGSFEGSCGDITITDGVTRVTATADGHSPCCIGKGQNGSCGTVKVGNTIFSDGITSDSFTYQP